MDAYKKRTTLTHQDEARKPETIQANSRIDIQRSEDRVNPMGNYIPNVNLEILEGKYQAKTEALEYKLRYEQVQRDFEELKAKYMKLENECEEDEGEEESGIMGNIMTMVGNSTILGDAIGGIISDENVRNFIVSLVPNTAQKQ
jgi:molybdopterin converting factor small subunit